MAAIPKVDKVRSKEELRRDARDGKWYRKFQRLQASLHEARREARWQEMQRELVEEGLKFVAQLEQRLASSGLRAGDWFVGRDAVGRALGVLKDLKLMRRHKERLLADDGIPDEEEE